MKFKAIDLTDSPEFNSQANGYLVIYEGYGPVMAVVREYDGTRVDGWWYSVGFWAIRGDRMRVRTKSPRYRTRREAVNNPVQWNPEDGS